jgi:hypothetical protein
MVTRNAKSFALIRETSRKSGEYIALDYNLANMPGLELPKKILGGENAPSLSGKTIHDVFEKIKAAYGDDD